MRHLVYILCAFVLLSCEKQIPYNNADFTKKLVVNATLATTEPMSILLSESVNPVQIPELYQLDGEVTYLLREDSVMIDYKTLTITGGKLELSQKPKAGKIYELEIVMDDFPPISMKDTVPKDHPEFVIDTLYSQNLKFKMDFTLDDNRDNQIYLITMRVHGKQMSGTDTFDTNYPLSFLSSDKVFLKNINNVSTSGYFGLFDDKVFNGRAKKIELEFAASATQKVGFIPLSIELHIANISSTMYNYYVGLLENNHIYGGPLATYSLNNGNVQDGLGLFAFYNAHRQFIDIP